MLLSEFLRHVALSCGFQTSSLPSVIIAVLILSLAIWILACNRCCIAEVFVHLRRGIRSSNNNVPFRVTPQVPLPAKIWTAAVQQGSLSIETRVVRRFYLSMAALSILWGVAFLEFLPDFSGVGLQLGVFLIVHGALKTCGFAVAAYGRRQVRQWIAYHSNFGEQPDEHVHAVYQKPRNFHFGVWWALGLINSPRFGAWNVFFDGLFVISLLEIATAGKTVVFALAVPLAMLVGVVRGGREFTLAAVLAAALRILIGAYVFLHLTKEANRHTMENTIIDPSLSIICVFLSFQLFSALLERLWTTETEVARIVVMVLRDIRSPLHGVLGNLFNVSSVWTSSKTTDEMPASSSDTETEEGIFEALACSEVIAVIVETMSQTELAKSWSDVEIESSVGRDIALRTLARQIYGYLLGTARSQEHKAELQWQLKPFDQAEQQPLPIFRFRQPTGPLRQLMLNLIANACKFTPRGGEVLVRMAFTGNNAVEGAQLRIEVEDSGPGVPLDERQTIFQPLKRGSTARGIEGSGLGLAVAADIAEQFGGWVRCLDGQILKGARFVVALPCEIISTDKPGEKHRLLDQSSEGVSSAQVPAKFIDTFCSGSDLGIDELGRILIVDTTLNARILKRMLYSLGIPHDYITTRATAEAVIEDIAKGARYNLIFADLLLPRTDGISFTRWLMQHDQEEQQITETDQQPRLIVVGSSATYSEPINQEWLAAGASFLLPKPFSTAQVANLLTKVCDIQKHGLAPLTSTHQDKNYLLIEEQRRAEYMHLTLAAACINFVFQFVDSILFFDPFIAAIATVMMCSIAFVDRKRWAKCYYTQLTFVLLIGMTAFATHNGCRTRAEFVLPALHFAWGSRWKKLGIAGICFCIILLQILPLANDWFSSCTQRSEVFVVGADCVSLLVIAVFVLVAFSIEDVALRRRERWIHTLSHDIRSPLNGVFAAIDEIDRRTVESSIGTRIVSSMIALDLHSARACASSLLALVDSVLSLERSYTTSADSKLFSLSEWLSFVRAQTEMRKESCSTDWRLRGDSSASMFDLEISQHAVKIQAERAPLFFVTSKFFDFVSQARSGGTVSLTWRTTAQSTEGSPTSEWKDDLVWLELAATEYRSSNPQSKEPGLHRIFSSASRGEYDNTREGVLDALPRAVAWEFGISGTHQKGATGVTSLFARVLRGVLGGVFEFCGSVATPSHMRHRISTADEDVDRAAWAMLLRVPVKLINRRLCVDVDQPSQPTPDFSNVRVFVVDDNAMQLRLIRMMLRQLHIKESETFRNATSFIERLDRDFSSGQDTASSGQQPSGQQPTLALLDLHLPDMDGADAWSEALGSRLKQLPLTAIACTGDSSRSTAKACERAGFVAVLLKPFSRGELATVLAEGMRRPH